MVFDKEELSESVRKFIARKPGGARVLPVIVKLPESVFKLARRTAASRFEAACAEAGHLLDAARPDLANNGAPQTPVQLVIAGPDLAVLEKTGDNLYRNVGNEQPQQAPDAIVHQGMLEGSNVKTIEQVTRLIEVNRAYDSISKMMADTSDLSRRSIERIGKLN